MKGRNPQKDYYKVLGVKRKAGDEEIRNAFSQLADQFNPDKNPGDEIAGYKFRQAVAAYLILSNPETRELYNEHGHPTSSIDDAIDQALDSARAMSRISKAPDWENIAQAVYSMWNPKTAWDAAILEMNRTESRIARRYGDAAIIATLAAAALGYAYGRHFGLDAAPFNWFLPSSELESYRELVAIDPEFTKSVDGYVGLVTGLVPSLAAWALVVYGRSFRSAFRAYKEHKKQG